MHIILCILLGGELLSMEESELLGEILTTSNIDFQDSGVNVKKLVDGSSDLTYEDMQFVLKEKPATRALSLNLKQTLQSSKLYSANTSLHLNIHVVDFI